MKTILLVDDDKLFRRGLHEELELAGYSVLIAESALQARTCFVSRFDLALFDYFLPDGNGIELLQELKIVRPRCPVVLITAHFEQKLAREAVSRGAYRLLDKLEPRSIVLPVVEEILGR